MSIYTVTDTDLTSVANAIRTKGGTQALLEWPTEFVSAIGAISGGGGATILSGTTAPTAAQGSNGFIYLQYASIPSVRYAKMTITAVRVASTGLQLSLVQLLDSSDNVISYPAGTTVTSSEPPYVSGESAQNLLSNVNTKYYTATNPSSGSPIEIVFDFGEVVSGISKWRWYTANDSVVRDPASFSFSVSSDGVNFVELDSQTITPTTDRNALAYTSNALPQTGSPIIATYAKVSGAWRALIGSDINDVGGITP